MQACAAHLTSIHPTTASRLACDLVQVVSQLSHAVGGGGGGGGGVSPPPSPGAAACLHALAHSQHLIRLRGCFIQTGTVSGRLAMDEPNLQVSACLGCGSVGEGNDPA
jgi:hypothetical protein